MPHLIFLKMAFAHFLFDFPLQGDFLGRGKHPDTNPFPEVPWYTLMWAHCVLQAGGVYWATGSLWMAAAEFVAHNVIDYMKCKGYFGANHVAFNVDQALHIACKLIWLFILFP